VRNVEEVGLGWMQMQAASYADVWGAGRHVLGSNYFYYVKDPWGSYFEYSADIDHVAAETQWPASDHEPEDSLYLWLTPNTKSELLSLNSEIWGPLGGAEALSMAI
jgi:hypothetical protein